MGELCFNTAMTGYQEILSDPSYLDQIIIFTFPHIGNVGVNDEDEEGLQGPQISACGLVVRDIPTASAIYRAQSEFDDWLKRRSVVGIAGVDTRALTRKIRTEGMMMAAIAHDPSGQFDLARLKNTVVSIRVCRGLILQKQRVSLKSHLWSGRIPIRTIASGLYLLL